MSDDPFAPVVDRSVPRVPAQQQLVPPSQARSRYNNRNWTAKGRLPTGAMNATETAYSLSLEARKAAGDILWWKFEGLKFRLADNSFYTPDFDVMMPDGQIECHEVKGLWEANARTKIKVASDLYPFAFVAVTKRAKKNGGGWEEERF